MLGKDKCIWSFNIPYINVEPFCTAVHIRECLFLHIFANRIVSKFMMLPVCQMKSTMSILILICFSLLYVRLNIFSLFFSSFWGLPDLALCPFQLGFLKFPYQFLIQFLKYIKEIRTFFVMYLIRHYLSLALYQLVHEHIITV